MPFRKKQEALDLTEGDMTDLDLTATSRCKTLHDDGARRCCGYIAICRCPPRYHL